jgi:hypothetical protein
VKWITPDQNDGRTIFVFGANLAGRHGAGAAKEAARSWGAQRGVGNGRQGQAYAIPTKDARLYVLPIPQIAKLVAQFKGYAKQHPELHFLVTEIGCGLAGYTAEEIAPLFGSCPSNCELPETFQQVLRECDARPR